MGNDEEKETTTKKSRRIKINKTMSNDQMRDHRLDLLEPRLFRRWYSCHIVNFEFQPFVTDEYDMNNNLNLSMSDFFSSEIQCNNNNALLPLLSSSSSNHPSSTSKTSTVEEEDEDVNMAWHFPVKEWDKNDRFCVRIPNLK